MISAFDFSIAQALYSSQTPFGIRIFSLLTELGSGAFIIVATALIGLLLWQRKRLPYAVGLIVATFGAIAASETTKFLVGRTRPPTEWHAVVETGYSFPSNHTVAAAALFGFLAYLAWKLAPQQWRLPLVVLCVAIVLTVGFSRLYLGVHYPTDVFAGFILGGLFAWLGATIAKKIPALRSE